MALPRLKPALNVLDVRTTKSVMPTGTPRQRGRAWMNKRARWLSANPLCKHCQQAGIIRPAQEVDHITPLCEGGRDDESNYQSLCVECHQVKTANEAKGRGGARVWND